MKSRIHLDTQSDKAAYINASDFVNVYVLAANVAQTITIPTGANLAEFRSTGNFFVNFNGGTAVVTAKTNGTGAELNPTTKYISGLKTLSVIATAVQTVTVSFFSD